MTKLLLALIISAAIQPSALAQVAAGDENYLNRAENHQGARANPARIEAAITAYKAAVKASPADLESRWKLARALRFKGAYVITDAEQKKAVFGEARQVSGDALKLLEPILAKKGIPSIEKGSDDAVAKAAKDVPNAGEVFYWDAVAWGEWALVYGKMAAVRQGAAERIRKSSTVTMLLDPNLEGGGGARVLGRLHNQTPRVPFMTGWASDELAVRYLREAQTRNPGDKLTKVFLAEAMVSVNASAKPQAIAILREVLSTPNDPAFAVEHAGAQEDAKALLQKWGVK